MGAFGVRGNGREAQHGLVEGESGLLDWHVWRHAGANTQEAICLSQLTVLGENFGPEPELLNPPSACGSSVRTMERNTYHPIGLLAISPPSTNVHLPIFIGAKYPGAADVARAASHTLILRRSSGSGSEKLAYERRKTGAVLLPLSWCTAIRKLE